MTAPADPILVAGGGLAGLACALALADAGLPVTLLETRKKLGGRATSHTDPATGETIDNCQHVALACCSNYLHFCRRLGVLDLFTWSDHQWWVEPGGRTSVIRPSPLPAPAHFTPSFLAARFLSLADKLAIARALAELARTPRSALVGRTFADFLDDTQQPAAAIRRFWSPVVVSACNLAVDRVDAGVAAHVFQDAFLASRRASRVALPAVPLVRLYDQALGIISRAGGRVLLGESVERLDARTITTATGQTLSARRVVCALPPERAARAYAPALQQRDPRYPALERVTHSPIVGVHLTYDRPILSSPHAVLLDTTTQWLFARETPPPRESEAPAPGGQPHAPASRTAHSYHAVISAADELLDWPESRIIDQVARDIATCFPHSARLLHARAIKERRATFAATPQYERLRPPQDLADDLPILAGDYTQTGWPATMEGAVRSGLLAAAAVLGLPPTTLLAPDPPRDFLAEWAGTSDK